jgi:tripartite-type tricarboxylate transporter receptor subunit TctC
MGNNRTLKAVLMATLAAPTAVLAQKDLVQGYPSKPVRLIVPFAQGAKPGSRRRGCVWGGARTRYWRSQPFAGSAPGSRIPSSHNTQMPCCEDQGLPPPGSWHRALQWLAGAMIAVAAIFALPAGAATYPSKPIRLIVPFAPGGGSDITARYLANKLNEAWGQPVIADNRAGANGTIAIDTCAKAPPDGYTLTTMSATHAVNVSLYSNLPYNLTRDLAFVTQTTTQPYALVIYPGLPAKSVKELIALAKAKPGALNYGSSGTGGLSHLAGALLDSMTGTKTVHIPYKGGAPAMTDVIAGQIQMLFSSVLQSHAHIKSGRLRALAVTTPKRVKAEPDLPTMQEAGVPGYEVTQWYGILAPAKTPQPIIAKLNAELVRILGTREAAERLAADGSEPVGTTSEQFAEHVRTEVAKWSKVVKEAGIRVE